MALITTGYAGTADINEANLDALLNQLLPDGPLGMVYIPEGTIVKRNQPGLAKVVNWLQHNENGVGEEGTIPVKSLVGAMLERNEKLAAEGEDADELILVMVYNNASGLDRSLVEEAHASGIRVIDLCAAGDDILPEEPEAPAEPPAEEQPPFEPDEPTEPTPAPQQPQESPGERVAKATAAGRAAAAKHLAPEPPAPATPIAPAGTPGIVFQLQVTIAPEHVATFARAVVEAMGAQAQATIEAAPLASVTALPVGDAGSNPADPAGQPEGTAVYYYHSEEDKYRPARGTKRKGEERVYLTPAEIADVKAKGLHR